MKYCSNCGNSIEQNWTHCPYCGQSMQVMSQQDSYEKTQTYVYEQQPENTQQVQIELPMKWYKFVIYAQLFLAAVSLFGTGIGMISGSQYGGSAKEVYALFGSEVQIVDVMFGIFHLALIPVAIIVRQKLAHYKAGAPKLLLVFYGAELGVTLIYAFIITIVSGMNAFGAGVSAQIFGTVLLIYFSRIYFKKREALFWR